MFADLYILRFSNDMKITVQKNHLGAQISWTLPKTNRLTNIPVFRFEKFSTFDRPNRTHEEKRTVSYLDLR